MNNMPTAKTAAMDVMMALVMVAVAAMEATAE